MSSSDKNTSTLKSYVDQATGAVQGLVGNLTGNSSQQAEGEAKQRRGEIEQDASHATAKIPGFAASSSGAVTRDDPDRSKGAWNQTVGSAKEAVGGLVGSQNLKEQGRRQNLEGQQQEAKGQLGDFTTGAANRLQGTVGSAVASLTGDRAGQQHYNSMHDSGKTMQRGAEHDIQKKADAEQRGSS